ncbi:MAG: hypothetical protein AAGB31_02130, partial [Bdellovibrio sp.]
MQSLRITEPDDQWKFPQIYSDLKDGFNYLQKNSSSINFNKNTLTAVAQNISSDITLTGIFFTQAPLDALSTLIHEARHSHADAEPHVVCRIGNSPLTYGGCDSSFSLSSQTAGAYSYDILYQSILVLLSTQLSQGDKEFLSSSIAITLAGRFNTTPVTFANRYDLILVMMEKGELALLHPFTSALLPLDLPFPDASEKTQRLEFSTQNGGALLFTNKGRVWTWSLTEGLAPLYPNSLPPDLKIKEGARIVLPLAETRSRFAILSDDHKLSYIAYAPQENGLSPMLLKDFLLSEPLPDIERFFMGLRGESYFITSDGQLLRGGISGTDTTSFVQQPALQHPQGWQSGTGGLVYEELYLISRNGVLYEVTSEMTEVDDYNSVVQYHLSPSSFRVPGKAIKYLQGFHIHAQLNTVGDLYAQDYATSSRNKNSHLLARKISDFVIMQAVQLSEDLSNQPPQLSPTNSCHLRQSVQDPWLRQKIGLRADGKLVFSYAQSCLLGPSFKEIQKISLSTPQASQAPKLQQEFLGLVIETSQGRYLLR